MIYTINEARNVEEYRAEKAAREKAEQDKKDKQYNNRYYKGTYGSISKTRADGHKDLYHVDTVGSRNRTDEIYAGTDKYHGPDHEDFDRDDNADSVARRNTKSRREKKEIRDATNRNMRRHPERWDGNKPVKPKTESTVFDDIEII